MRREGTGRDTHINKKTSWEDREPMDHRTPGQKSITGNQMELWFGFMVLLSVWGTRKPRFDSRANTSCPFWFMGEISITSLGQHDTRAVIALKDTGDR